MSVDKIILWGMAIFALLGALDRIFGSRFGLGKQFEEGILAIGALSLYISGGSVGDFQPMNINFGIITPLDHRVRGKRNKNAEISARSLQILDGLKQKEVFHL